MPKPVALSSRAYQQLRQRILSGEVQPAEPLFEIHLAEQLGSGLCGVRRRREAGLAARYGDALVPRRR